MGPMEKRDSGGDSDYGRTLTSSSAVAERRLKAALEANASGAASSSPIPPRSRRKPLSAATSPAASERSNDDAFAAQLEPRHAWAARAHSKHTSRPKPRQPQTRSAPPLAARSPSRSRRWSRAAAGGGGDERQSQPSSSLASSSLSVWDSFADHVKGLSTAAADVGAAAGFGNSKSSFRDRISPTFMQTLARLHEIELRRTEKAAAAAAASAAVEVEGKTATADWHRGDDKNGELDRDDKGEEANADVGDSMQLLDDDEDDEETRELRRQRALAHWSVVRRHVGERIRKRKENSTLSQSWNILRQQLRAMTRADKVRRDLYLRYGVTPPDGQRYPRNVMIPSMSERAKEIILRFEAITLT